MSLPIIPKIFLAQAVKLIIYSVRPKGCLWSRSMNCTPFAAFRQNQIRLGGCWRNTPATTMRRSQRAPTMRRWQARMIIIRTLSTLRTYLFDGHRISVLLEEKIEIYQFYSRLLGEHRFSNSRNKSCIFQVHVSEFWFLWRYIRYILYLDFWRSYDIKYLGTSRFKFYLA